MFDFQPRHSHQTTAVHPARNMVSSNAMRAAGRHAREFIKTTLKSIVHAAENRQQLD
jgi:hypothetical protein